MDFQQFRAEVIASNLANEDTPGYKARRVMPDFGKILEETCGVKSIQNNLRLATTDSRHMPADGSYVAEVAEISEVKGASIRVDQNTVNSDEENRLMAEAQISYETAITIHKLRGSLINMAIER